MARLKRSDFTAARERIAALPEDRRRRIEAGAAEILKSMHLAELRKAMDVTQARLSDATGMKQAEVSRVEKNPETVQIRTLERYVRGLGGELKIVAEFPDGTHAEIPIHAGKPVRSRIKAGSRPGDGGGRMDDG